MARIVDRVVETTQTTGTGTVDLLGAQAGYLTFGSGLDSADQVYYLIEDDPLAPTAWEFGVGTWTEGSPDTLARDTVINSSNSGNRISLQAGQTYVVTGTLARDYFGGLLQASGYDTTAGKALIVGAFGLGVDTPTEVADCNNITWTSWYRTGSSTANRPLDASSASAILRTEARTATFTVQTYIPAPASASFDEWVRTQNNGTWSDWRLSRGEVLLQRLYASFDAASTTSSTSFQDTHAVLTLTLKSNNSILIARYSGGHRSTRSDGGTSRAEYRGLLSWSPSDGSGSNSSSDAKLGEVVTNGTNSAVRSSLGIVAEKESVGKDVDIRFMVQQRVVVTAGETRVEGTGQKIIFEEWLPTGVVQ